jgi:hypothetical protein
MEAVLSTLSPCERRLSVSTRGRPLHDAALHCNNAPLHGALHTLRDGDMAPGPQPGASGAPVRCES